MNISFYAKLSSLTNLNKYLESRSKSLTLSKKYCKQVQKTLKRYIV